MPEFSTEPTRNFSRSHRPRKGQLNWRIIFWSLVAVAIGAAAFVRVVFLLNQTHPR